MTAKEALRDMVDRLSEEQASAWLAQMRVAPPPVPWRERPVPPSWQELAAMSPVERDEVFRRWPARLDPAETAEWEATDLAELSNLGE